MYVVVNHLSRLIILRGSTSQMLNRAAGAGAVEGTGAGFWTGAGGTDAGVWTGAAGGTDAGVWTGAGSDAFCKTFTIVTETPERALTINHLLVRVLRMNSPTHGPPTQFFSGQFLFLPFLRTPFKVTKVPRRLRTLPIFRHSPATPFFVSATQQPTATLCCGSKKVFICSYVAVVVRLSSACGFMNGV